MAREIDMGYSINMADFNHIGTKIKEIRKRRKISQEKLAELVSMNNRSILRIENQQNLPTLEILAKIAEVLEVPITDFFEGSTPMNRQEVINSINSIMAKMTDKELQTFYKAIYHFYY